MTRIQILVASLIVLIAVIVGAYWKGWINGREHERFIWEKKVADMQVKAVRQQGEWQRTADNLAMQVRKSEEQITAMGEKIRELVTTRTSPTRRCLAADVTRLLNTLSPIRTTVTSSSGTVETVSTTTTDTGGSSERAVAIALIEARGGYAKCVGQLHSLIDWVEEVTK